LAKVKLSMKGNAVLAVLAEAKKSRDLDELKTLDVTVGEFLAKEFKEELSEPAIAFEVAKNFERGNLFLASSRPIRDFQRYAGTVQKAPQIFTNRGASGIDGNLATVAGVALGSQPEELTVALVGDLASLHDLNSLSLISQSRNPILLVVVNNDGGGIFSFLPVAQHQKVFEKYWGTPHGYEFEKFAQGFNLPYKKVESAQQFTHAMEDFKSTRRTLMVEIKSHRQNNFAFHQKILEALKFQVKA
jgi:2-succinyl-5-enolpyruvyl-6-hydroxy-3-cyclohexene-1-carboxylate synthase